MAKGIREIKRQIKSKQNTRQITKAMEMVAASKLKRAQNNAEASRPYADKIREVVFSVAAGSKGVQHPMLQVREVKRTGYLVLTSDRGLAGGFNANVLRKALNAIRERHKSTDEYAVFVVGRKGKDFFKRRNIPVFDEVSGLSDSPTFADIKQLASSAVQNFIDGNYDELYVYYNQFHNAITQTPVEKKLLPLEQPESGSSAVSSYEYEPSAEGVLEVLLPKYAETVIFSAVLESKASEFGARMTAMGSATKNATKMIAELTLSYNRARQAAITQEISEIVAGANALN
ncbi:MULTISPECIES: ATP synthase F1 subunit gamma [Paenibacillus]|uniref:ATP synthase gamma chain n=1 Tax=Paenibacillus chitinolyticus TaxID=79263 RepID=A0A410WQK7_9BACL|nr:MULTISPECIES: ATP synthase F1 subunit gamma [Paenibacillus]EGL13522.1 ATP synthase F1, gamma subunit [Paenibacillus sp. HGF7]EPD86197.1 ATP synthase F1, gamma subunit [Paenibacillus sp. HGH0039]MBV6716832.1 F0F1 ATP synthase subunit gamma [Paenibacillus chitinolyticus]MCY9591741.1 ATP synthase F1 subunit gamma [Paenibacillus chitinolyticus]MCY9596100.1 ATP synthase F1 subunit gamma [Paenibacillus chitinolyticus]